MSWLPDTVSSVRIGIASLALGLLACEHTTNFKAADETGEDGGLDGSVQEMDAGETDSGAADGGAGSPEGGVVARCGNDNHVCACADLKDNDKDGVADGLDNECTGAFDDDEGSFKVNDVRTEKKCSDCFYDGNPASGDDRCDVSSHCVEDGMVGIGGGMCKTCEAAPACQQRCLPITPNGCDCFGCCEVSFQGGVVPIRLVASCTMKVIDKAELCPSCVINRTCFNPCDACDLCPGKTLADLPVTCVNGIVCNNDRARCNTALDCNASEYCGQGCCLPILY